MRGWSLRIRGRRLLIKPAGEADRLCLCVGWLLLPPAVWPEAFSCNEPALPARQILLVQCGDGSPGALESAGGASTLPCGHNAGHSPGYRLQATAMHSRERGCQFDILVPWELHWAGQHRSTVRIAISHMKHTQWGAAYPHAGNRVNLALRQGGLRSATGAAKEGGGQWHSRRCGPSMGWSGARDPPEKKRRPVLPGRRCFHCG